MMSFCQHMTCPLLIGESVYDSQLEVQNFSLHAHAWSKVNHFVSQSVWIWGMRNRKFICYGLMHLITYDRWHVGYFMNVLIVGNILYHVLPHRLILRVCWMTLEGLSLLNSWWWHCTRLAFPDVFRNIQKVLKAKVFNFTSKMLISHGVKR